MSKRKKKQGGYLFIYMTDAELSLYGPDHYNTIEEALAVLWKDCKDIARHQGRNPDEILMSCMEMLEDQVRFFWWKETKKEDPEDDN